MQSILQMVNVSFGYENSYADRTVNTTANTPGTNIRLISNLNLAIETGKFYTLLGSSGCGKSTILKLMAKLLKPEQGQILHQGVDINACADYMAYMPQKDMLFLWRNVWENLALPLEIKGVSRADQKQLITSILTQLNLVQWQKAYPHELSGGMRQRVAFARTLLCEQKLLLLDEPFASLDVLTRMDLQEWLMDLLKTLDKTIFMITHDVDEALFLSDKVLVVNSKPITSLQEFSVPLPKNRTLDDLQRPDLVRMRAEILNMIRSGGQHEA